MLHRVGIWLGGCAGSSGPADLPTLNGQDAPLTLRDLARAVDMETAAVGQVAYSNGVPYIAFRSLSDLAGGGDGANEMDTFMHLAAANSAKVLQAFLAAWK